MKSQTDRLYDLLSDSEPHSTNEIIEKVYPNEGRIKTPARISARAWDVKHKYGVEIESNPDEFVKGMWWYRIVPSIDLKPQISQGNALTARVNGQEALFPLPEIKPKFQMPD